MNTKKSNRRANNHVANDTTDLLGSIVFASRVRDEQTSVVKRDRRVTFSPELNLEGNYRSPPRDRCKPTRSRHLSTRMMDPKNEHSSRSECFIERNLYLRRDFEEDRKDTDWRKMIFHCFIIHLDLPSKNIQRIEKNMFGKQTKQTLSLSDDQKTSTDLAIFKPAAELLAACLESFQIKKRISHSFESREMFT